MLSQSVPVNKINKGKLTEMAINCLVSGVKSCGHRMDKRKFFVFSRQYRNCFSPRINTLLPGN